MGWQQTERGGAGSPVYQSTSHQSTSHQSPVTSHQSPVTSHQSPVTSHQSPATSHQLSVTVTSHQLSPISHHPSVITLHHHSSHLCLPEPHSQANLQPWALGYCDSVHFANAAQSRLRATNVMISVGEVRRDEVRWKGEWSDEGSGAESGVGSKEERVLVRSD